MPFRRRTRWLIAAALGVLIVLVAGPGILCENALHILPQFRYTPQPELAETLARETNAAWQPVEISAADGALLRAWWFVPAKHGAAAVILLHGVADTRRGVLGHARFLLRHGFAVLTPDARGHGASGGEPISYGLKERGDVHRWADWIYGQSQPFTGLYGLGESMGAAILLQSLEVEPRFHSVVAECPFFSFEEIAYDRLAQFPGLNRFAAWPVVEPSFFYARLFHGFDLRQASPAAAVRSTHVPILLIHGTADTNVPPRHSRALHALRPLTTELWEVPGARHVASLAAEPKEYEARVVAWFRASP
jgi:alpha-beta hydrolase superfamily lysophospholipase